MIKRLLAMTMAVVLARCALGQSSSNTTSVTIDTTSGNLVGLSMGLFSNPYNLALLYAALTNYPGSNVVSYTTASNSLALGSLSAAGWSNYVSSTAGVNTNIQAYTAWAGNASNALYAAVSVLASNSLQLGGINAASFATNNGTYAQMTVGNATYATTAGAVGGATNAVYAINAGTATNALNLGGVAASGYAQTSGNYPNMNVGTATFAGTATTAYNSQYLGGYGAALYAFTNGNYQNMNVGTATYGGSSGFANLANTATNALQLGGTAASGYIKFSQTNSVYVHYADTASNAVYAQYATAAGSYGIITNAGAMINNTFLNGFSEACNIDTSTGAVFAVFYLPPNNYSYMQFTMDCYARHTTSNNRYVTFFWEVTPPGQTVSYPAHIFYLPSWQVAGDAIDTFSFIVKGPFVTGSTLVEITATPSASDSTLCFGIKQVFIAGIN